MVNASRLWARQPSVHHQLFDLLGQLAQVGSLTVRDRGIVYLRVFHLRLALWDWYCALAWGRRLADEAGAEAAGGVLAGEDAGLDDPLTPALASWARRSSAEANSTTADNEALRKGRLRRRTGPRHHDAHRPSPGPLQRQRRCQRTDRELVERAPALVADAVTFAQPTDGDLSGATDRRVGGAAPAARRCSRRRRDGEIDALRADLARRLGRGAGKRGAGSRRG